MLIFLSFLGSFLGSRSVGGVQYSASKQEALRPIVIEHLEGLERDSTEQFESDEEGERCLEEEDDKREGMSFIAARKEG